MTEAPSPAAAQRPLHTASWRSTALPEALEQSRQRLDALLALAAVDARTLHACELVLEEWLTNVGRHGVPGPAPGGSPGAAAAAGPPVTVRVEVYPNRVLLHFSDAGRPFDPVSAPPPPAPTDLAHAEPGGLGLTMIRRAVSGWRYARVDGRNELQAWVDRPAC